MFISEELSAELVTLEQQQEQKLAAICEIHKELAPISSRIREIRVQQRVGELEQAASGTKDWAQLLKYDPITEEVSNRKIGQVLREVLPSRLGIFRSSGYNPATMQYAVQLALYSNTEPYLREIEAAMLEIVPAFTPDEYGNRKFSLQEPSLSMYENYSVMLLADARWALSGRRETVRIYDDLLSLLQFIQRDFSFEDRVEPGPRW